MRQQRFLQSFINQKLKYAGYRFIRHLFIGRAFECIYLFISITCIYLFILYLFIYSNEYSKNFFSFQRC